VSVSGVSHALLSYPGALQSYQSFPALKKTKGNNELAAPIPRIKAKAVEKLGEALEKITTDQKDKKAGEARRNKPQPWL